MNQVKLGCPTCKGGVPFYQKNIVECFCINCHDFIGLSGTFKQIEEYQKNNNKLDKK